MLVFDATSEASLAEVQRWAAASALQAAEIRLMVANKVDRLMKGPHVDGSVEGSPNALKRSSRLAAAQAWCSEHLYEYIEVSGLVISCCSNAQLPSLPHLQQAYRILWGNLITFWSMRPCLSNEENLPETPALLGDTAHRKHATPATPPQ